MKRRKWISTSIVLGASTVLTPKLVFGDVRPQCDGTRSLMKLSSNENPYGPSEKARLAIKEHSIEGNRYPNDAREQLTDVLSTKLKVSAASILLGSGSSDLLQLLACWCIREKKTLITSKLTFDILPKYVKRFGGKVLETELTAKKAFDLDALEAVSIENPGVVYLVNPNNPTGSKIDFFDLVEFCGRVSEHSIVIVDEAYIHYLPKDDSVVHLINENPRIIVLRTFSKIYGLAGLRVGYAIANPKIINVLKGYQVWSGSNLNILGLVAATASMGDSNFVAESKLKNIQNRRYTLDALRKLNRYCVEPHANFIWFKCNPFQGFLENIYAENKIIVGTSQLENETWMRVTIGKKKTMQRFVEVAKSIWT